MPQEQSLVEFSFLTYFWPFILAGGLSFLITPLVIKCARKFGALDIPKDNRRMHKKPIPRLGGIAIFIGFLAAFLRFCELTQQTKSILIGAAIIVVLGIIDDIFTLKAWIKLIVQIIAAAIPALNGVVITTITNPNFLNNELYSDLYLNLGYLAIPLTIFWIVGITNAVNLIDGLDGLAVGISSIASISVFVISIIKFSPETALVMAALAGACLGFMPFNINPAKIFMGDTGATFLGYILAVVSVQGLFKFYTAISFAVPFIVLGLPIFDTSFAILRRISHGQSPMTADRSHVHHKLIDMGFSQKQSVAILYSLSAMLGLLAVLLTSSGNARFITLIFLISLFITLLVAITTMNHKHKLSVQHSMQEQSAEQPAASNQTIENHTNENLSNGEN